MLSKALIERFIGKYNLGGAIETVQLVSDGESLTVDCCNEAKTVFAFISTPQIAIPEGKFNIFETAQLRSLLSVLGDEVELKVRQSAGVATSFNISDKSAKVTYALADPSVLPIKPVLKNRPEPEVTIVLNKLFMDTFVKARGALSNVEHFTVLSDGTKTEVVLGYEEHNSTNVTIQAETVEADVMKPTAFIASLLKDIISSNKEAKNGTLTVSEKGFACVTFEIDGFSKVEYILLQQRKN
jgi:hypothetical protein